MHNTMQYFSRVSLLSWRTTTTAAATTTTTTQTTRIASSICSTTTAASASGIRSSSALALQSRIPSRTLLPAFSGHISRARLSTSTSSASSSTTPSSPPPPLPAHEPNNSDESSDTGAEETRQVSSGKYGGALNDQNLTYAESLEAKYAGVQTLLAPWLQQSKGVVVDLFESPPYNYRNRADFSVWWNSAPKERHEDKHDPNSSGLCRNERRKLERAQIKKKKLKRLADGAAAVIDGKGEVGKETNNESLIAAIDKDQGTIDDDKSSAEVITNDDKATKGGGGGEGGIDDICSVSTTSAANGDSSSESSSENTTATTTAATPAKTYDGKLYYAMSPSKASNLNRREKLLMEQFRPATVEINLMMRVVLDTMRGKMSDPAAEPSFISNVIGDHLFTVAFKSTSIGQGMVTMSYSRPFKNANTWMAEASALKIELEAVLGNRAVVVGRAKGMVLTTDEEGRHSIEELMVVDDREFLITNPDNCFTQPNQTMNHCMVNWVHDNVLSGDEPRVDYDSRRSALDALELYCGNGNFSTALSLRFRRLLVTETSRAAVEAARLNIDVNNMYNTTIVRISAHDLIAALQPGARPYQRLSKFTGDFRSMTTVLVDPPREGMGALVSEFVGEHFENIVYMSCNPESLIADLHRLGGPDRFEVSAAAMFDQFPFTHHTEICVVLRKKKVQELAHE